jgi:hypothetical protein
MANLIHSRAKGEGEFHAASTQLCFKCMERGEYFVLVHGNRKFACRKHHEEYLEAASKDLTLLEDE